MKNITVPTNESKEIIPITEQVRSYLYETEADNGVVTVFCAHTTAAITTADLDPGTDQDMLEAWYDMLPAHLAPKRNGEETMTYRHPHNPYHTPDHILASIVGPTVAIPVESGRLQLGTWQEVILCEFDGPRERSCSLIFYSP